MSGDNVVPPDLAGPLLELLEGRAKCTSLRPARANNECGEPAALATVYGPRCAGCYAAMRKAQREERFEPGPRLREALAKGGPIGCSFEIDEGEKEP
jgi:hypothetical protein